MFDLLRETLSTMKMNKLRTFLTGMSMSWGLFILIVLLGTGNGFVNGIKDSYSSQTTNVLELAPDVTTINWNGFKKGRYINLYESDVEMIDSKFDNVSIISPSLSVYGNQLKYKTESMDVGTLTGQTLDRFKISDIKIVKGRTFNEIDMTQARKVAIIDKRTMEVLFKDEDPIGKNMSIDNISVKVIGVFELPNANQGSTVIVPLSTIRALFPNQKDVDNIMMAIDGIETVAQSEKLVDDIRVELSKAHNFSPEDKSAVWIYNMFKEFSEIMKMFSGLNMFLWLIGIGTMISGIVGIANIMLVTVKERTKEFGIRKALGAKSSSIISLVLSESLIITVTFGYVGIFLGMGLLKILSLVLGNVPSEEMPFMNPSVSWGIISGATIVLIIVALLAAYVPTKRAVAVKPVEALNYE